MLTTSYFARPVYRLRAGEKTNARGETVPDWDNPTRTRIPRAQVQDQQSGAQITGDRLTMTTGWTLLITGTYDLLPTDRVEYAGGVWTIDGRPFTRSLMSGGTHTEARLKATEVR